MRSLARFCIVVTVGALATPFFIFAGGILYRLVVGTPVPTEALTGESMRMFALMATPCFLLLLVLSLWPKRRNKSDLPPGDQLSLLQDMKNLRRDVDAEIRRVYERAESTHELLLEMRTLLQSGEEKEHVLKARTSSSSRFEYLPENPEPVIAAAAREGKV